MSRRVRALLEVVLCSGYPTQLLILVALSAAGLSPRDAQGQLSLAFVALLSLADAALLVSLVFLFLVADGDHPREVFLGHRPVLFEVTLGVLLIPVSFLIAVSVLLAARIAVPSLHNVAISPFEGILQTSQGRAILGVVVTVAGGLREEIQRAFILRRFEQSLGGAWLGLVLFSVVFGFGHIEQGRDVALATAALGAFWGIVYLRRRSIASTSVAHAGFNLSEILRHGVSASITLAG